MYFALFESLLGGRLKEKSASVCALRLLVFIYLKIGFASQTSIHFPTTLRIWCQVVIGEVGWGRGTKMKIRKLKGKEDK